MNGMIKMTVLGLMVLIGLGGTALGGWFTFEPNVVLLDGTPVALELSDIKKESTYLKTGDTEKANQLIKDEKVYLIKADEDQIRVEYVGYEEHNDNIFVRVQNESGTKLWTNMIGLACVGQDGNKRTVTKQDVLKEKFTLLPKETP